MSVEIRTLMMIDSLHMTAVERETIAQNCAQASEDQIVVTHGTGTMVETAQVLASKIKDKTIVLTGAMVPYKFGSSDGLFNLGGARVCSDASGRRVYRYERPLLYSGQLSKEHKNRSVRGDKVEAASDNV